MAGRFARRFPGSVWTPPEARQLSVAGVYRTDLDALRECEPDVVLTQVQGLGVLGGDTVREVERAVSDWAGRPVEVVHLAANSLEEAMEDVSRVASAAGMPEEGRALVASLRWRMRAAQDAARGRPVRRLACVQWPDPLYAAGAWVPELVHMAGAEDVLAATAEARGGQVDEEDVVRGKPDVLLLAICGVGLRENKQHARNLARRLAPLMPGAQSTCLSAGLAACDGLRTLSRPGPLLADALEMLVEMLHPEAQGYGRRGTDWDWVAA